MRHSLYLDSGVAFHISLYGARSALSVLETGQSRVVDPLILFDDGAGQTYRLKVTDLSWQYFCHSLRSESYDPKRIAAELTETLQERRVYLRIGLSRGWKKFPERCFLQVNGVYTFPDYLEGRTFADFAPRRDL